MENKNNVPAEPPKVEQRAKFADSVFVFQVDLLLNTLSVLEESGQRLKELNQKRAAGQLNGDKEIGEWALLMSAVVTNCLLTRQLDDFLMQPGMTARAKLVLPAPKDTAFAWHLLDKQSMGKWAVADPPEDIKKSRDHFNKELAHMTYSSRLVEGAGAAYDARYAAQVIGTLDTFMGGLDKDLISQEKRAALAEWIADSKQTLEQAIKEASRAK
jgi:hypothetical protein